MFTLTDYIASGVGLSLGLAALFWGRRDHDGAAFMLAFGSGTSAVYLFAIAYALAFDGGLLTALMKSNSVIIFGALLYAGIINLRSLRSIFPAVGAKP